MAQSKTNAMRILERAGVPYKMYSYESSGQVLDGVCVAQKLGLPAGQIFKTLVTQGASREYFVFVLPANRELDLKKAARAVGEKNVEMIHVKDLNRVTGYIRGGCSPIGMKKQFTTVVDSACEPLAAILVSAGKIGQQVELAPQALISLIGAQVTSIAK